MLHKSLQMPPFLSDLFVRFFSKSHVEVAPVFTITDTVSNKFYCSLQAEDMPDSVLMWTHVGRRAQKEFDLPK